MAGGNHKLLAEHNNRKLSWYSPLITGLEWNKAFSADGRLKDNHIVDTLSKNPLQWAGKWNAAAVGGRGWDEHEHWLERIRNGDYPAEYLNPDQYYYPNHASRRGYTGLGVGSGGHSTRYGGTSSDKSDYSRRARMRAGKKYEDMSDAERLKEIEAEETWHFSDEHPAVLPSAGAGGPSRTEGRRYI